MIRDEKRISPLIFRLILWALAGIIDAYYVNIIGYEALVSVVSIPGLVAVLIYIAAGIIFHLITRIIFGFGYRSKKTAWQIGRELCWDIGFLLLVTVGLRINEQLLPSFGDPVSILWNIAILLATIGVVLIIRIIAKRIGNPAPYVLTGLLFAAVFIFSIINAATFTLFPMGYGKPNIILITLDTVRADHLSSYGYDRNTSPDFDNFAIENQFFTSCRTPMPLTSPAHASLFSGEMPHTHGVLTNISAYPDTPELSPLAHELNEDYYTAGFPAAVHMGKDFNFDRGFRTYNQSTVISGPSWLQSYYQLAPIAILSRLGIIKETYLARNSRQVNRAFLHWLDNIPQKQSPFFAWLHYFDAHSPYQPPEEYWKRYDPDYSGSVTGSQEECDFINSQLEETNFGETLPDGFNRDDIDNLIARYDGEIRFQDESLGELFDALRGRGLWEDTVIIIVSDHGEGMYDDGYFGHNFTLKEYEIQIACAIKGPDINCPEDEPLSITDLTDYIEYVSGLNTLTCRLSGKGVDNDDSFTSMVFLKSHCRIDPPYKLVRTMQGEGRGIRYSLYNLEDDPFETSDIFNLDDPQSIEMKDRLEEWLDSNRADFPDLLKRESTLSDIDPRTLEMLRSLGYIY